MISKLKINSLLILLAISTSTCKKFGASKSKAIVSQDGKSAFSVIPMRNSYKASPGTLFDDEAQKVENALRLTYVPVECTGENAALFLNIIEASARGDSENIRRRGREILTQSVQSATSFKDCKAIGTRSLGGGSFIGLFNVQPNNQAEFEVKQTLWLAMRGQANLSTKTFSQTFYNFISENLGAVPDSFAAVSLSIEKLDATYNPCVNQNAKAASASKFDKNHAFICLEDKKNNTKNYQVTGTYESFRNTLTSQIDRAELDWHGKIDKLSSQTRSSLEGIKLSTDLDVDVSKVFQNSKIQNSQSSLANNIPDAKSMGFLDEYSKLIKAHSSNAAMLFSLSISSALSPVFSYSNPRKLDIPSYGLSKSGQTSANWTLIPGTNKSYKSLPPISGKAVVQLASLRSTQNGGSRHIVSEWLYLGATTSGDEKWKRRGDTAVFYLGANGSSTRNLTNDDGSGSNQATSLASYDNSSNTSFLGLLLGDHQSPVSIESREDAINHLGWTGDNMPTPQKISQKGYVIPNVENIVGVLPETGKFGSVPYDKKSFNCQASAASCAARLNSLIPGASVGTFAVRFDDPGSEKPVGHSVNWLRSGTSEDGQPLYRVLDSQTGLISKDVTKLDEGLKDIKLAERYQHGSVQPQTAEFYAEVNRNERLEPIRAYDPNAGHSGMKSVAESWDQSKGALNKTFTTPNGEVPLFNENGSGAKVVNWDFVPGNGEPNKVQNTLQESMTPTNSVEKVNSLGTNSTSKENFPNNAALPPSNSGFGGYVGSDKDLGSSSNMPPATVESSGTSEKYPLPLP